MLPSPHTTPPPSRGVSSKPNFKVNSKGFIEAQGVIEEALPSGYFKVVLENGHVLHAHLSGKMRLHRIMLVPGDTVKVEISQYDLTKGRITFRL